MRIAIGVALTAVILVTPANRGWADDQADARAIIDRGLKALGGEEKLAPFTAETWKTKGKFSALGMVAAFTCDYAFQEPNRFRFVMALDAGGQKFELTAVSNGQQAWEKAAGMMREMAKEKFIEFQHNIYSMYVASLKPLKDKAFTLSPLGENKVNDRPTVGVRVSRKDHRDVNLYFDNVTGLLAKIETRVIDEFSNKEVTQETFVEDYKEINGLKYFFKMTIKRDGKTLIEEDVSDQQSLAKLPEELFVKP